jgi:hypothetical protein
MPLALVLVLGAVTAHAPPTDLSFRSGRLDSWEGGGFAVTTATGAGPSRDFGVCSADDGNTGRTGLLHQTFVVPPGVTAIRFTAAAWRRRGCKPGPTLDVVLEGANREFVPKRIRAEDGYHAVGGLSPTENGKPREYEWSIAGRAGQALRFALIDDDPRPGCCLFCSGFRFVTADEANGAAFAADMLRLERDRHLPPMARLDSAHFIAIGDAADDWMERRLDDGETLHAIFFEHFRSKGFPVQPADGRLMMAVFGDQDGFEAYLGRKPPDGVTGVYDPATNRLVVYDFGRNRMYEETKRRGDAAVRRLANGLQRDLAGGALGRAARNWRDDVNVATVMHETAHQLSFNCGLLSRTGDVPGWLAEGLACYCESTANGAWQGVGEPNPARIETLAATMRRGGGALSPLRALVESDDWVRRPPSHEARLLGYAQSWALFRMLMEERPEALRKYLDMVRAERTPEHRLEDFVVAFGNFDKFERRYQEYVKGVVEREAVRRK